MQSMTTKLNIWQEVHTIEPLSQPLPTQPQTAEKNQAPQETWFQLLQYPTQTDSEQESLF